MEPGKSRSGLRLMRIASGPLLCAVLAGVFAVASMPRMPGLPVIFILVISYSVLSGGVLVGTISGALSLGFVVHYYATPGAPFHYDPPNVERLTIFALAMPLVVATMGSLRSRLDNLFVRERKLRVEAEAERARISSILESITDGFFALDRQWRYTYVNRRAEALVGRTREQLLGQVVWEAFPPLVGSAWDREYHRAVAEQAPVHFEELYAPFDTWFETLAYPSPDGLTIYMRSIDDRKRAEQALGIRAAQQAAVAKLGQAALLGGDLRSLMDAAARTLASTLEVPLVKVLELLPDGEALVMRAGVGWTDGVEHRVEAGERSQAGYTLACNEPVIVEDLRTESRFRGPRLLVDHDVTSGASVIITGHGRPFGILGVHTRTRRTFTEDDVHFLQAVANVLAEAIERKRGEDSLAESEQRFRQLAQNVREVFYISTVEPVQMLYVSPAYESVWGRPCASLYENPRSWLEAIHPDDRAHIDKNLPEKDSGFFDGEYRVVRADGSVRWVRDRSSPVRDDSGRIYRVVGIAEDVTDLKEAAEAETRVAASQAAVRARDEVLAVVAHDLRNPLGAISMTAQVLGRPDLAADKRSHFAEIIERAVQSAHRLVRDLLDVARVESGQLAIERETVDVARLLAEACDLARQAAREKSLTVECEVPDDLPPLTGDCDRLLQALGNLLGNAVKFTPKGGRITARARLCVDGIQLSVQDTGAGIPADALPHVFDRFWRARPTDRKGLGLGLAIVKGIVDAHRGRVWAESEPGKGSTFHFVIPVELAPGQQPRERVPRGSPEGTSGPC